MGATAETIEGVIGAYWFHYDVRNDVLYLRLESLRGAQTCGEESDDGFIVHRAIDTDAVAGMTVVNWWKRFGQGALPDSIRQIIARIEPMAERLKPAA